MDIKPKLVVDYKNKKGKIIKKHYETPYNRYTNPCCYWFENGIVNVEASIPKDGEMMLYHYDNLVKGIKANKDIYFLGNEFDVEYLENTFKLTATTLAHYAIKIDELRDLFSIFKGTTLYITTEWLKDLREYNKLKEDYWEYGDYWINGRCYDIVLKILYEYANKCYILPVGKEAYQDIKYFMIESNPIIRDYSVGISVQENIFEKLKTKKYELDGNNFILNKFQPNEENAIRPFGGKYGKER